MHTFLLFLSCVSQPKTIFKKLQTKRNVPTHIQEAFKNCVGRAYWTNAQMYIQICMYIRTCDKSHKKSAPTQCNIQQNSVSYKRWQNNGAKVGRAIIKLMVS